MNSSTKKSRFYTAGEIKASETVFVLGIIHDQHGGFEERSIMNPDPMYIPNAPVQERMYKVWGLVDSLDLFMNNWKIIKSENKTNWPNDEN